MPPDYRRGDILSFWQSRTAGWQRNGLGSLHIKVGLSPFLLMNLYTVCTNRHLYKDQLVEVESYDGAILN